MPTVLIVDDEPNILEILAMTLQNEAAEIITSNCGQQALAILKDRDVDLVVTDIKMPDLSGVELLREAESIAPGTVFIMMTAFAGTETAIEALQHGAFDYLTKPFSMEELRVVVARALAHKSARKSSNAGSPVDSEARQSKQLFQALHETRMVGKSPKMVEVYKTIGNVAAGDSTVLVTGESGTGKELVARAIHQASRRRDKPFVSINCGAFPETLLESELFGYMKGAFTGATSNKKGLFEAAEGGSIFLDEIGDMTPPMQVKLLRVLQERRLRPLGGSAETPIDVRVIAATNRNLQTQIEEGRFREDLYYRIAVITIHIPALRERIEDIEALALAFLRQYSDRMSKSIVGISPEALRCLQSYSWPGNVRQLENTLERAVALETTEQVQLARIPEAVRNDPGLIATPVFALPEGPFDLEAFLSQVESSLLTQALQQSDGNQTLAAQRLKLTKGSLRHRLQALHVRR